MTVTQDKIRNIAIIAHVDHGKTTLVDKLFSQSGTFRDNQQVEERLMDSMDLERERGITIMAKNGSCSYNGYKINIIDTPGHADFGGEVERVLTMADGAVFLVDAAEGPMPQSYFVLKKAVAQNIPVIVVVNKIDKPAARCEWVVDQVFDLLASLDAPDHILDFPVIYASAKEGFATNSLDKTTTDMTDLFDLVVSHIPAPSGESDAPLQLRVCSISYSSFLGRLAIGKIHSGSLKVNQDIAIAGDSGSLVKSRATKLYGFQANQQVEISNTGVGDIVCLAGLENVRVGETITDPNHPKPLPVMPVDPPTVSMTFLPNDSPFAGKEGEFVTSRQIEERLQKELLTDVALHVESLSNAVGFKVSGRGELHLSILIEKMRREGYELQVSKASVIFKEENGQKLEPFERLTIEVDESVMGSVIERLGTRKGQMLDMHQDKGMATLTFSIPTRGLLGFQSEFMVETKGLGAMFYTFDEYRPFVGEIRTRKNGVIVVKENCATIAFALFNIQERGTLFLGAGENVYEGQIIGEHARENDLVVNPAKGKKLTNMRSSGSDDAVVLVPPKALTLEECIAFIDNTELVEVTPKAIRVRKRLLSEADRKRAKQL